MAITRKERSEEREEEKKNIQNVFKSMRMNTIIAIVCLKQKPSIVMMMMMMMGAMAE